MIAEKLEESQEVDINSKRSYKKVIWQEKTKSTRIKGRRQYMAGS